jgi:hypothetical protein
MSDYKSYQPVRNDGEYLINENELPGSTGLIGSERSGSIGRATSTQRVTAKPGDEDKIALDVSLSDGDGNSINKDNALPVYVTESPGTEIEDFDVQEVASDGTQNHDYVVGAEFRDLNVMVSSAGRAKFTIQVSVDAVPTSFSTVGVVYTSTSNNNAEFALKKPKSIPTGYTIRVIKQNDENKATDLNSTINGAEV